MRGGVVRVRHKVLELGVTKPNVIAMVRFLTKWRMILPCEGLQLNSTKFWGHSSPYLDDSRIATLTPTRNPLLIYYYYFRKMLNIFLSLTFFFSFGVNFFFYINFEIHSFQSMRLEIVTMYYVCTQTAKNQSQFRKKQKRNIFLEIERLKKTFKCRG